MSGIPEAGRLRKLKASESLCGQVIRGQRVKSFDLTKKDDAVKFADVIFLEKLTARRMITVPIFNPCNQHHLRYLLNLFPLTKSFWGNEGELSDLGLFISRLADHVADDVCSAAAGLTSFDCGVAKSRQEFLKTLLDLIKNQFNCEGISIFFVNEIGDRLELDPDGTTGVDWRKDIPLHERYYRKGQGMTGTIWATGEMRLISEAANTKDMKRLSWEIGRSTNRDECLFEPLARLGWPVSGVIRLINKRVVVGSLASLMFTDDDAAVLDSIIQAALPHLELLRLQERQTATISRMVHEFQVPALWWNLWVNRGEKMSGNHVRRVARARAQRPPLCSF